MPELDPEFGDTAHFNQSPARAGAGISEPAVSNRGAQQAGIFPPGADAPVEVMQIPTGIREVFLSTMREDHTRLASAVSEARLDRIQLLLHRIRGVLVMAAMPLMVKEAYVVEEAISDGCSTSQCLAAASRFLFRLNQALVQQEEADAS